MRRARIGALAAALVGLAASAATAQQDGTRTVGLTTTMHAGGAAFTRFQNVTLETDAGPETYPASIAASASVTLGADLTVWFQPWLGVRLDLVYVPSNFEVRLAEEDREAVLGADADYRTLDYSDLSMFDLNAAVVLALPIRSAQVAPYAFFGGGGAYLTADERDARGLDSALDGHATQVFLTGLAGFGVRIPLEEARVSLTFEIADRVFRSPIPSGDDRVLLDTGELRVVNRPHPNAVDSNAHYTHAVGISAALSFRTGGMVPGYRTR